MEWHVDVGLVCMLACECEGVCVGLRGFAWVCVLDLGNVVGIRRWHCRSVFDQNWVVGSLRHPRLLSGWAVSGGA